MMFYAARAKRAGFTLIEIMIVIAVIAILAGIMVPNFMQARAEANYEACLQNCKTIGDAISMALVRYSDQQLCKMIGRNGFVQWNDKFIEKVLVPLGYLTKVPVCPANISKTYGYSVCFNCDTMLIYDGENFPGWTVYCGDHKMVDAEHFPQYGLGVGLMDYNGTGGI